MKRVCVFLCVMIFSVSGCSRSEKVMIEQSSIEENAEEEQQKEKENSFLPEKGEGKKENSDIDMKKKSEKEELLEEAEKEKLAKAREQREKDISFDGAIIMGKSGSYQDEIMELFSVYFDKGEMEQCYRVAVDYLKEKLHFVPETKLELYHCYDKKILKIYEDEDRGYLKDYDISNIYVWEYKNKAGEWRFIFMGRKNSTWEVIHEGDTYTMEKRE